MRAADLNLQEALQFDPKNGIVKLGQSRMVVNGTESVGALYKELIDISDIAGAQVVMRRFGEANGRERARTVKAEFQPADKMEWFNFGPTLHAWEGVGLPKLLNFEYDGAEKFLLVVEFLNSYTAIEYVRMFGQAHEPVCWMLAGYIAGYCSEVFDLNLLCRESTCVAKGDPVCTFTCKPRAEWF